VKKVTIGKRNKKIKEEKGETVSCRNASTTTPKNPQQTSIGKNFTPRRGKEEEKRCEKEEREGEGVPVIRRG